MHRLPPALRFLPAAILANALLGGAAFSQTPQTMRVDYLHSGNALQEQYALERIVIDRFCDVCSDAIETIIDLYSRPASE